MWENTPEEFNLVRTWIPGTCPVPWDWGLFPFPISRSTRADSWSSTSCWNCCRRGMWDWTAISGNCHHWCSAKSTPCPTRLSASCTLAKLPSLSAAYACTKQYIVILYTTTKINQYFPLIELFCTRLPLLLPKTHLSLGDDSRVVWTLQKQSQQEGDEVKETIRYKKNTSEDWQHSFAENRWIIRTSKTLNWLLVSSFIITIVEHLYQLQIFIPELPYSWHYKICPGLAATSHAGAMKGLPLCLVW